MMTERIRRRHDVERIWQGASFDGSLDYGRGLHAAIFAA
jgi:hypothetical protein